MIMTVDGGERGGGGQAKKNSESGRRENPRRGQGGGKEHTRTLVDTRKGGSIGPEEVNALR